MNERRRRQTVQAGFGKLAFWDRTQHGYANRMNQDLEGVGRQGYPRDRSEPLSGYDVLPTAQAGPSTACKAVFLGIRVGTHVIRPEAGEPS